MSRIYYSFHHNISDSLTVDHKTYLDGCEMKKGIFRSTRGVAEKSLTALAGASKVKWNYEPGDGLLGDPAEIARYIFDGYKAKHDRKISGSLAVRFCDSVYRLICKITHTQTRLQRLAGLVSVVQGKTFEVGVTHRVQLKRDIARVKAGAAHVLEETREVCQRIESKLKSALKEAEGKVKEAFERLKELKDIRKLMKKELRSLKEKFMGDFMEESPKSKVTFQMFSTVEELEEYARRKWKSHSRSNPVVLSLIGELEVNKAELEEAEFEYECALEELENSPLRRHLDTDMDEELSFG